MPKLDTDDLVLAVVDASDGHRIQGRTVLQKLAYFVSEIMAVDAGYRPHYYGPYSEVIAATTEGQVSRALLDENIEVFDGLGFAGHDFPRKRYTYELTERGKAALKWRRDQAGDEFKQAEALVQKLMASNPDYRVLSYAAKLWLILQQSGGKTTFGAASQAAKEYGWSMSKQDMQAGVKLLADVDLVNQT